jgi:fatty-acyl-CoA synthase
LTGNCRENGPGAELHLGHNCNPKGVVIHHRGAYLNCFGNAVASAMSTSRVFVDRRCFIARLVHLDLAPLSARASAGWDARIFTAIKDHRDIFVAPDRAMMITAQPRARAVDHPVEAMTGGAAPPAAVIARMEAMGISVTHLYGLTETYGPTVACAWHEDWDALPLEERARLKSRVGVRKANMEEVAVLDPQTLAPVPRDGVTIGEIMMRGNIVMSGYLKNPQATAEAFSGGWYHTGDLGVTHPDGYIQIKDRSKDIIISGGENISSIGSKYPL